MTIAVGQLNTGTANDYIYGIAFGPDGNLYCAALSARRVLRITPTLAVTTAVDSGAGLVGSCTDIKFGPQGQLFVATRNSGGQLMVFTPASVLANSYTAPAGLAPRAS